MKTDLNDKTYLSFLALVFGAIVVLSFFYSTAAHFGVDEFEHIHTSWKILQGKEIFVDFFQHHHPFFNYFLVPVISIFGETTDTLFKARYIMFLMLAGILVLTYLLAVRLFKNPGLGLISLILTITFVPFYKRAIHIRPDVPQAFFGLLSIYFLYVFYDKRNLASLAASSVFLAVSFLILQKSIFLVFLIGLLLLYCLYKKEILFKEVLIYGLVFLLCISPYYVYLILSGTFEQYIVLNWLVNIYYPEDQSVRMPKILGPVVKDNLFTLLLYLIGLAVMLRSRVRGSFAILSMGLLVMTIALLIPGNRQLILVAPLIAIIAAYGIHTSFKNKFVRLLVLLLAISIPMYLMYKDGLLPKRDGFQSKQIDRINYVLSVTDPGDKVYDARLTFNLYREDIDYFWFCIREDTCLDAYRILTGYEYDIYELISKEKPRVISTVYIPDLSHDTISNYYEPSKKYRNILIRKE